MRPQQGPGGNASPRLVAVILAGGAGTRFWPLSRKHHPKPLLRAGGQRSLLAEAVARARSFAGRRDVWLVCGADHAAAMRKASGLPKDRVLVEPVGRNTAPAVALAAARIAAVDPEAIITVLSADHRIPDAKAFAASIRRATPAAQAGGLVTIGVRPTRPEPGYGYIRLGRRGGRAFPGVHRVARFVEKPKRATAERYLARGGYLWNAGIFVWSARAILEEIEQHAPRLARGLAPVRRALAAGRAPARSVAKAWPRLPAEPIDTAVLEKSRQVWCLPVDWAWSDVGTWASLAEALGVDAEKSRVLEGEALLYDAPGNLVRGHDRPVVLLGVEGLAVIDAGDALLVTTLAKSGAVRDVVARLRKRGRIDLL
jgi:mannose-1-phosphate guanylyltransferase/mannose-6-phosphate isomerase